MLEKFRSFAQGLDHPEGVAWGLDGRIYAGGEAGQVYRVGFDGEVDQVADTGGFLLGVTLDGAGRIYGCDLGRAEIVRVDAASGKVETYSSGTPKQPARTPNWAVFDPDGVLYFTDSGEWKGDDGLVFRVAPDGETSVWTTEPHRFPNGCALSPSGDALYIVESTLPGITRIPIRDDGSAGALEVFVNLPGTVPDGVAFDADGNLYVACYRPDRIYRVTPEGKTDVLAEDPQGVVLAVPTNIAFAGENLDRLVVASLGRWHLTVGDIGAAGAPLNYPQVA
ncbi:MAG: SMP-30/gluconolactonase/LRE family protein [Chloroflexi bacterium]|nr:SMP-30/gluconolactonase/LRE family protein [Chloroflexota bacterium]